MAVTKKNLVTIPKNVAIPNMFVLPWLHCQNDEGRVLHYVSTQNGSLATSCTTQNDSSNANRIALGFSFKGLSSSCYITKFELTVTDNSNFQNTTSMYKSMIAICGSTIFKFIGSNTTNNGSYLGLGGKCASIGSITPSSILWQGTNESTPNNKLFDDASLVAAASRKNHLFQSVTNTANRKSNFDLVLYRRINCGNQSYDLLKLHVKLTVYLTFNNTQYTWTLSDNMYDDDNNTGSYGDWSNNAHVLFVPLKQSVYRLSGGSSGSILVKYV